MKMGRLFLMVAPGAVALFLSSVFVSAEDFASTRCVCDLPEAAECYWQWTPPAYCGRRSCFRSGGSAVDTCGEPGVRRNPWGVGTAQQAPAGRTAYAVDTCNQGGVTAGGSMTDSDVGKLRHRNRCANCRGKVHVTMVPSFNTCAHAMEPPSTAKAYGLMEATGVPVQPAHRGPIVTNAGGAASGYPSPPTVQFTVGIGPQPVQVTLTQGANSAYSKVPVSNTGSRTWYPDVSWVNLTFLGSANLEAFADGWFATIVLLWDLGAAAANIPYRGYWNVDFVLECVGTCGRIQSISWDKGWPRPCPATLP